MSYRRSCLPACLPPDERARENFHIYTLMVFVLSFRYSWGFSRLCFSFTSNRRSNDKIFIPCTSDVSISWWIFQKNLEATYLGLLAESPCINFTPRLFKENLIRKNAYLFIFFFLFSWRGRLFTEIISIGRFSLVLIYDNFELEGFFFLSFRWK